MELKTQVSYLKTEILNFLKSLCTRLKVAAANTSHLKAVSTRADFRTDILFNSYRHSLVTLKKTTKKTTQQQNQQQNPPQSCEKSIKE